VNEARERRGKGETEKIGEVEGKSRKFDENREKDEDLDVWHQLTSKFPSKFHRFPINFCLCSLAPNEV
jgi:hypothetical protein